MTRRVRAAVLGVVVLGAGPATAESPEITPEQWRQLTKAVRYVKRDRVTVDDARIAPLPPRSRGR